jgi:hypothetical protein
MMLFAYAISGDATLTPALIDELRDVATHLAEENLPCVVTLGFDWASLQPGPVEGTFLRGYQRVADRTDALYLVQCLRRLSQRFPRFSFYLSGAGDLPMTQLQAGRFELFAETYDRALRAFEAAHAHPLRRHAGH